MVCETVAPLWAAKNEKQEEAVWKVECRRLAQLRDEIEKFIGGETNAIMAIERLCALTCLRNRTFHFDGDIDGLDFGDVYETICQEVFGTTESESQHWLGGCDADLAMARWNR